MSKMDYKYSLQRIQTLTHLPNTILTVSEMTGEGIPADAKQYFVNTTYRIDEKGRAGPDDAGLRRTQGFSVQSKDIPGVCKMLMELYEAKTGEYYFICPLCTKKHDKITVHRKNSADAPDTCQPSPAQGDSFIIR